MTTKAGFLKKIDKSENRVNSHCDVSSLNVYCQVTIFIKMVAKLVQTHGPV